MGIRISQVVSIKGNLGDHSPLNPEPLHSLYTDTFLDVLFKIFSLHFTLEYSNQ